jgi:hypothetical protein
LASGEWIRHGPIVTPPTNHPWWVTHAQSPTILALDERLWRIYFGARDAQPLSRIMCVDVDPSDGMRIVKLHEDPVLEHGPPGCFDCHGVAPGAALIIDGRVYLYYTGAVRRLDVPYTMAIGLAVSDDGLNFSRRCDGPIRGIGPDEPYFSGAPFVGRTGSRLELWYISGLGWSHRAGEPREEPVYNIRRVTSTDGISWSARSELMIGDDTITEHVVARPWVLRTSEGAEVWYSARASHGFRDGASGAYRIWHGRIRSDDGHVADASPIAYANPPGLHEWDGEMQAYGSVARHGGDLVMFYNGNGFGRTGFGYARLAVDDGR